MKLLFTKGSSPLSKAIVAVTGEPVSHVAINSDNAVVHSNLLGLHVTTFDEFRKHAEVVLTLDIDGDPRDLLCFLASYRRSMYDIGAMLFLGLAIVVCRWLRIPRPKKNLWADNGSFDCVEAVTKYMYDTEDGMLTPYKLYIKLLGNKDK